MMAKLKRWIKSQATYQVTSMEGVKPELRLRAGTFYLNSAAGQITYRPPTVGQLTQFRDIYVNRFECLVRRFNGREDITSELFALYRELRISHKKVRWSANANTRVKAALHVFGIRRS